MSADEAREVCGDPEMGYRYRAGIQARNRRGREQFRFVGEYHFIYWKLSGPGLLFGKHSRWFDSRDEAVARANRWLDSREWKSPNLDYVGEGDA